MSLTDIEFMSIFVMNGKRGPHLIAASLYLQKFCTNAKIHSQKYSLVKSVLQLSGGWEDNSCSCFSLRYK